MITPFKKYYIYVLLDPRKDGRIFYVGKGTRTKSGGDLERYHQHLAEARRGKVSYKCKVIRAIWRQELEVEFTLMSRWSTEEGAMTEECRLITELGIDNLTNCTDGGEGMSGFRHSEETRKKLSKAQSAYQERREPGSRCLSKEARKKLATACKRYWSTPEAKRLQAEFSKKYWATPGVREAFSDRVKQAWTPERRKKTSERTKKQWAEGRYRNKKGDVPVSPEGHYWCNRCKQHKLFEDFPPRKARSPYACCRSCETKHWAKRKERERQQKETCYAKVA